MKKLTLTPQKDTITICIPGDWVGKQISCILQTEESLPQNAEACESNAKYKISCPENDREMEKAKGEDDI